MIKKNKGKLHPGLFLIVCFIIMNNNNNNNNNNNANNNIECSAAVRTSQKCEAI